MKEEVRPRIHKDGTFHVFHSNIQNGSNQSVMNQATGGGVGINLVEESDAFKEPLEPLSLES